jgi:hypothetical protein
MKRPRIKSSRVNVQQVIEHLENKRRVYSEAITDLMNEEGISYTKAKELLNQRLRNKVVFKF